MVNKSILGAVCAVLTLVSINANASYVYTASISTNTPTIVNGNDAYLTGEIQFIYDENIKGYDSKYPDLENNFHVIWQDIITHVRMDLILTEVEYTNNGEIFTSSNAIITDMQTSNSIEAFQAAEVDNYLYITFTNPSSTLSGLNPISLSMYWEQMDGSGPLDDSGVMAGFSGDSFTLSPERFNYDYGIPSASFNTSLGSFGLEFSNIQVNPVPIPAAVWLFGSGLIGLIGVARRKKS